MIKNQSISKNTQKNLTNLTETIQEALDSP